MNDLCERVRLAELAVLDGETPPMPIDAARAHQAGCAACRDAVAAQTALHRGLGRLDFERLDVDLWTRIRPDVVGTAAAARERLAIGIVAAVLIAWRVTQLSIEWSAPLMVSLAVVVAAALVFWKLAGDPLAIRSSISELKEEGVR